MSARSAALIIALLSATVGCASSPARRIYVLSAANAGDAALEPSRPSTAAVLRLARVLVPNYLDTTDILMRAGEHELRSSQTGRWGERLSAGVTRALQADLADRVPARIVVGAQPTGKNVREILVTVNTFDVWADGRCILTADWTLPEKDGPDAALTGHGAFTTPAGGGSPGDAAVLSAMANAVSQLADGIASTLKGQ